MRKQNKIVSLILVVALLFSMLVIATPAAAAATTDSANDSFTPSATYAETADGNTIIAAAKYDSSDNLWTNVGAFGCNGNNDISNGMTTGVLTNTETGEKYLQIIGAPASGVNTYLIVNPTSSSGVSVTKGTANQYYVLDVDIALYDDVNSTFGWYAVCRGTSGSGCFGTGLNGNAAFRAAVNALEKGEFHHFTTVLDFDNNTATTFINGEWVVTLENGVYGASGASQYEAGFKFEQFRMFPSGLDSCLVDNINIRKASDIATLASALSAKDISAWSEDLNGSYDLPTVPAIAEVDGVKYYDTASVTAALASYKPVEAEILRDYVGTITVACDATVETNGVLSMGKLVAGTDTTVSVNGSVYTYDGPFIASATETAVSNNNFFSSTVAGNADNLYYTSTQLSASLANLGANTMNGYVVTPYGSDNSYLDLRIENAGADTSTHAHVNWNESSRTQYAAGTYTIIDFDLYSDWKYIPEMYLNVTSRTSGGTNVGGGAIQLDSFGLTPGQWSHVTMVGSVANNTMYVFVNNTFAFSSANGLWGASADGTQYFEGLRLNLNLAATGTDVVNGQNTIIDNMSVRFNYTDDEIAGYCSAANLAGWSYNLYGEDYEYTELATAVVIDGVDYASVAAASAALNSNGVKNVYIAYDYAGTLTVNSDAVIETNGLDVSIAYGEGVTYEQSGTVITTDAPYIQSETVVGTIDKATIGNATAASGVTGNLYSQPATISGAYADGTSGYANSYVATNTIDGNSYWKYIANGVTNTSNSYNEIGLGKVLTYDASVSQYAVYDFDFARLGAAGAFSFSPTTRQGESGGGAGLWATGINDSALWGTLPDGEFVRFTIVYDFNNNVSYLFINGSLKKTTANGVMSADGLTGWKAGNHNIYHTGLRFGQNGVMSVALDNISARYISGATDYSATLAGGSLGDLAVDYTLAQLAPVASVDGEHYGSVSALNAALVASRGDAKQVEILCDLDESVVVSCDATVQTNGLNVTVTGGTGCTVTDNGDGTYTVEAPFIPTATEADTTRSAIFGVIKSTVSGNTLAYTGEGNWNAAVIDTELVTPNDGSSEYIKLTALAGTTTANHYVNVAANGEKVFANGGYYVVEADVATETEFFMSMNVVFRDPANTFGDSDGVFFADFVPEDGDWHHLTLVGDVAANLLYVFVDGTLAGTSGVAYKNSPDLSTASVQAVRINIGAGVAIPAGATTCLNNFTIRNYATDTELATAITSGTLAGWSGVQTTVDESLPAYATVDGKNVSNVYTLADKLDDGLKHAVTLERAYEDGLVSVVMKSEGTINTNGLANYITAAPGYLAEVNGNIVTVTKDARTGKVTITITAGDSTIVNEITLDYGTDVAAALDALGIGGGIVKDSKNNIYTDATWDTTPSGVIGEGNDNLAYSATATKFDGVALSHNNGTVVSTADSAEAFFNLLKTGNATVELNKDVEWTFTSGSIGANTTLYLNGHTYEMVAEGNHAYVFSASSGNNFNVYGPGTLKDTSHTSTHAMFYCDYSYVGTANFYGVTLLSNSNVATLRGGNMYFEDCEVKIVNAFGNTGFHQVENYNGNYTKTSTSLKFVNSELTFTTLNKNTSSFFFIKANADNTSAHYLTLEDCVINVGETNYLVENANENATVSIGNSIVLAKNLVKANVGKVVVTEGTKASVSLNSYKDSGLVEAYSGDPLATYVYTANYATVIWSDGSSAMWADGTYPVHATLKTDSIQKVVAGETYNFTTVTVGEDFKMSANLTLDDNIILNVYIPTSVGVTNVNIGGVDVAAAEYTISINGVKCNKYSYALAPHAAADSFGIAVTTADFTVAKSISLSEYADLVFAQDSIDASGKQLVANVLNYVNEAYRYNGRYSAGLVNIRTELETLAATSVTPTGTAGDVSALASYITGASLNIDGTLKFRFNLAADVDASDVTFTVAGADSVEVENSATYVELTLRAYDMLRDITISVNGATGTYNLYTYYTSVQSDTFAEPFVKAIWSYCALVSND